MGYTQRFEDLETWQIARILSDKVYLLLESGSFGKDFDLISQMRRSTGSCMDNIAEGHGRGGNREFIQFLTTVTGSASEVKSQLYRALDRKYITRQEFEDNYELADKLYNKAGAFIQYLLKSSFKGEKFKDHEKSEK